MWSVYYRMICGGVVKQVVVPSSSTLLHILHCLHPALFGSSDSLINFLPFRHVVIWRSNYLCVAAYVIILWERTWDWYLLFLQRTYTYVFSSYFIFDPLVQEYKSIGMLRQAYLMSASPQPDQFSVLVRGIPKPEKEGETYSEKVEAFFIEFHPLHYLSHQMVFQSSELECLLVHISPVSSTNEILMKS